MIDLLASVTAGGKIISPPEAPFYPEGIDTRPRAPIDEETGIPLLIATEKEVFSYLKSRLTDHHLTFPELNPILCGTPGGHAMRVSRIQTTVDYTHNIGPMAFHSIFGDGPPIPQTWQEQVGYCALMLSGFLPRLVVDTSIDSLVREMSISDERGFRSPAGIKILKDKEVHSYRSRHMPHSSLHEVKALLENRRKQSARFTSRQFYYGYDAQRLFFQELVFDQNLRDVKENIRNPFTDKNSVEAGMKLIGVAIDQVVSSATVKGRPLSEIYRQLYVEGRLHPLAPTSPTELIKHKIGSDAHRASLLPRLHDVLATQLERVA